ncbi:TIGR00153 family protein [Gilvimarinus sp. F26214L]|uniref:TIGR00153 family protein n=1 Tax=Gilvimarinus sp. DZF01 TaxID=3461371 RepID=UPI0040467183
MAMSNPFSSLFGRSPIKPMQDHMTVACATADELVPFFKAVVDGNWDHASTIQQKIAERENEADALKKNLRLHLPKSLFLPVPRTDLLELLSMQDAIANCARDIAGIMLGRKMSIPSSIQPDMLEFVQSAVDAANQALKAINELDELLETGFSGRELKVVENLIEELDKREHRADELEVEIRAALFAIEDELPPVDVMFLYRVIEWIGELSNRAQRVGSRLQLLLAR